MCFETTKTARAKIAKTDIVCWKALEKISKQSVCEEYEYKKGLLQPRVSIEKDTTWHSGCAIWAGYHSCKTKQEAKEWKILSGKGVFKFIIPAGTRYFENETEYVSETIMML